MNDCDRERFASAIAQLAAIFRTEITDETIAAYWDTLGPKMSIGDLMQAARELAVGEKFPIPRDFVDAIFGTEDHRAEQAWLEAWTKAKRVGAYLSPEIVDCATIKAIREMGGWPEFCLTDQPVHYHRRRFVELYKMHASKPPRPEETPMLRGIHEQDNSARGISAPEWAYREIGSAPTLPKLGDGNEGEPN